MEHTKLTGEDRACHLAVQPDDAVLLPAPLHTQARGGLNPKTAVEDDGEHQKPVKPKLSYSHLSSS